MRAGSNRTVRRRRVGVPQLVLRGQQRPDDRRRRRRRRAGRARRRSPRASAPRTGRRTGAGCGAPSSRSGGSPSTSVVAGRSGRGRARTAATTPPIDDRVGRAIDEGEARHEAQVVAVADQPAGHRRALPTVRRPARGRTCTSATPGADAPDADAVLAAATRPRHVGHGDHVDASATSEAVFSERRCCRPPSSACSASTWLPLRLARRVMPRRSSVSRGTPTGSLGSVSGSWASMSRQAIFTRPWALLATSRCSSPPCDERHHVERLVHGAELGDRAAHGLGARCRGRRGGSARPACRCSWPGCCGPSS